MNERLDWMLPSFPGGRILSTDIRVNWSFALVPLVIFAKYELGIAAAFTVALYLSVLIHELAHAVVARWMGGSADEVHITPIGGLALVRPGRGAFGFGMTAAAGPAVNLLICLCVFPGWYARETLWDSLNPLVMPIDHIRTVQLWHDLGLLLFIVNWILLLINLLPVIPLDGGQILRAILTARNQIHPEIVHRATLRAGLIVAVGLLFAGVAYDKSQIVLLGTFILVMNVVQLVRDETGETMDDSSMSDDFSSGYESLERSSRTTTREARPGMLQRWRDRRRLRKEQQDRIRRMEAEQHLDALLAKVHEFGLQSLSEQEKKLLRNCSELLRDRNKSDH